MAPGTPRPHPPRFGFHHLLRRIEEMRQDAAGGDPDGLDRRVVLNRLCRELESEEALVLLRGFDRAYRQVIEGV